MTLIPVPLIDTVLGAEKAITFSEITVCPAIFGGFIKSFVPAISWSPV